MQTDINAPPELIPRAPAFDQITMFSSADWVNVNVQPEFPGEKN